MRNSDSALAGWALQISSRNAGTALMRSPRTIFGIEALAAMVLILSGIGSAGSREPCPASGVPETYSEMRQTLTDKR